MICLKGHCLRQSLKFRRIFPIQSFSLKSRNTDVKSISDCVAGLSTTFSSRRVYCNASVFYRLKFARKRGSVEKFDEKFLQELVSCGRIPRVVKLCFSSFWVIDSISDNYSLKRSLLLFQVLQYIDCAGGSIVHLPEIFFVDFGSSHPLFKNSIVSWVQTMFP